MSKSTTLTRNNLIRSKHLLAACPISGIVLEIAVPAIPHYVLEYQNPLTDISNAKAIASQGYSLHRDYPPEILSGVLLVLLNNLGLTTDSLTATDRNILLQQCPLHSLSDALHLFANVTRKQSLSLPHISFECFALPTEHSSNQDIIKNYIKVCTAVLNPEPQKITLAAPIGQEYGMKGKVVDHVSITPELRKEFKSLASQLFELDAISRKFYDFLREVAKDNNLIAMDQNMRDKLISKLQLLAITPALQLAIMLSNVTKNMTVQERIFKQNSTDGFADAISSTTTSLGERKTLAEILAAKKQQLIATQEV